MTLHNTPARLDVHTLVDERPRERFANAELGTDPLARDRSQAMVVMEVWDAARGPEAAPIVADTLPISPGRIEYLMAEGQAWLWEAVANPAVWVMVDDSRTDLAEVLEEENARPLRVLASRIRRERVGGGQYVPLTLRELRTLRPIVEAIPDYYAVRDRLLDLVRTGLRDAAAEQYRRFRADWEEMQHRAASPRAWAELYGYRRACTVLEQLLAHDPDRHPVPYLGDGSETRATAERLGELYEAVAAQERDDLSWEERDHVEGYVMSQDAKAMLRRRPGTWRWGQTHA
ncbi:hypothetical protein [Nocardiopsis synnemataformans]|uniref:hypothetical protein n=1 Tax=Nocardiopsis synnemataformans TaxID=61305 RepID=UPI003EBBDD71